MKQQFKIIQNQKQKFSAKLVPSMEILRLSQQDLESLVDTSLIDNPFSDIEQNQISLEAKDIDLDYKKIRKRSDDIQEFDFVDENKNDLIEHVMPQLMNFIKSKKDEEIFKTILESLDSRGFLAESEDELCKFLNIKKIKLEYYLDVLKHIEPKGLASKNYTECILVQLKELKDTYLAQKIVKSHLENIVRGEFSKVAKIENVSVNEIKESLECIQKLNPIPANGFKVSTKTIYIVPDVYIRVENREIIIEMNSKVLDKLQMNVTNYDLYKKNAFDLESKEFLKQKLNDFKMLQYSVSRRSLTLKTIVTYLINYQKKYFLSGDENQLQPLRILDIANMLKISTSTVSRALSNKYFQCEYGTYPFSFLLPKCYEKKGEIITSINTIKNEILQIIKFEDQNHPYSDEQIRKMLDEEGYVVSRRSITLYRKECCIPSSRNRKIIQN